MALDRRQVPRHIALYLDRPGKSVTNELNHFVYHVFDLQNFQLTADSTGEGENLFNHLRPALGAGRGSIQHLAAFLAGQLIPDQVPHHENRCQHVVQVVSYSTGQRPDAFHPLRPKQIRFNPLFLGDVRVDHQDRLRLVRLVAQERPVAFHDEILAILADLVQFALPLFRSDQLLEGFQRTLVVRTKKQFAHILADGFLRTPTKHPLGTLVPV